MLPWNPEDLTFDEARFGGTARLFPLPNLVLFPHVMQPLRVFEPQYRALLNAALDSDGLIAISVLSPGRKTGTKDRPSILPYACLSKVITHHRKEDGQYDVLMLGMRRVRIIGEIAPRNTYREATVEVLDDFCDSDNDSERDSLQTALMHGFQENLPTSEPASAAVRELLSEEIPLGVLTDLVSFALPLSFTLKCQLLAESDVDRRAGMLLEALASGTLGEDGEDGEDDAQPKPKGSYLPPFSRN